MMPKNRRIRLKSNKYILSEFKYFSSDDDDDDDSSSFIMPRMYFKVSDTKSLLPLASFLCSSLFLLRLMERDFIKHQDDCSCDHCRRIAAQGRKAIIHKLRKGMDFTPLFREDLFEKELNSDDLKELLAFRSRLRCAAHQAWTLR